MKKIVLTVCTLMLLAGTGNAVVLYDGSHNGGTETPDDQGWYYLPDPIFGHLASNTASGGVTTLDTTATNAIQAGYFSHDPSLISGYVHPGLAGITLDRIPGYTVEFSAQVTAESHANNDRAGFSLIVLSTDLMGIELGFWQNQIWAQSGDTFTHAESTGVVDTTLMTAYNLAVSGDDYTLFADNIQILTGNLRNYSGWTSPVPGWGSHPYDIPNFLFFGDDTSSAQAQVNIASIEVNSAAVPEPSALVLFFMGILYLRKRIARLLC